MNKFIALLLAAITVSALAAQAPAADQMSLVPGFVYEDIYKGNGMISIDFDPTGALFVTEKQGRVLLFEPKGKDFRDPAVILDIRTLVNPDNESGLLGLAIDPQFNANHYVYVFYTTTPDQRLVRYTLNPGRTALTDPVILLQGFPKTHTNHKAGDIHFRPGEPDNLYIVLGNDADPNGSLIDTPTVWNGKILRVNKANGQGLADNPFYDNNLDSIASRVWAMGLRNPFRFTFAPSGQPANHLFVSENGDGVDRFYLIGRGANGGWNHGGDNGWWQHPPADQDVHILGTHKPSMTGIAIAETGPFASPQGPVLYEAHWYAPEEILRGVLGTPQGGAQWSTFTPIPGDPQGMFAVHLKCVNMKFGPDGNLYVNDSYFGDSKGNSFRLGRIKPLPSAEQIVSSAPVVQAPLQTPQPALAAAQPKQPASIPEALRAGGYAILKKEVEVTTQFGTVGVPVGARVHLVNENNGKWTVEYNAGRTDVSQEDLTPE